LHLSADGNSYSGTVESIFYDLLGNLIGQFAGTIEATRIKPS
jgi:hypothetical protein